MNARKLDAIIRTCYNASKVENAFTLQSREKTKMNTNTVPAETALNTKGIHHTILKLASDLGATIFTVSSDPRLFRLEYGTDDGLLRADHDNAVELRKLLQEWAIGKNTEGYLVEGAEEAEEVNDEAENTAEAEEDEEAEVGTSTVVKDHYKKLYKDAGHANNNGDWLNEQLDKLTKNKEGEFVLKSFVAIIELNGITDWRKYQKGNPRSDNGQIRMNASNRLRTIARKTGILHVPGADIPVPASFMKPKVEKIGKALA